MKLLHHIEQELFERGVSGSLSNLLVDIAEEAEPEQDAEGAEESRQSGQGIRCQHAGPVPSKTQHCKISPNSSLFLCRL